MDLFYTCTIHTSHVYRFMTQTVTNSAYDQRQTFSKLLRKKKKSKLISIIYHKLMYVPNQVLYINSTHIELETGRLGVLSLPTGALCNVSSNQIFHVNEPLGRRNKLFFIKTKSLIVIYLK